MGVGVSRRRILHITTFLQGGAGRIVADLACRQRADGWRPIVACASAPVEGYGHYQQWLDQLADHEVPVVPVSCTFRRSPAHAEGARAALERLDAQGEFALVHAHAAVPASLALQLPARPPVLATMHGWNAAKSVEHAAHDVAVFNRLPVVVVPSSASARHLRAAGVEPERLRVIPYGVAPPVVRGLEAAERARIEGWRAQGRLVAVCVGSVGMRKRQATLLEALARAEVRDRLACVFVGEGPDLPSFESRARALGLDASTAFLGYRRDVGDWLASADLAVFPSSREGLPVTLLEAAALGCVVVATSIPEHLEVIEPGATGLTCVADDADSLAGALLRLLTLEPAGRRALGTRLRQRWEAAHRPDAMVRAYQTLYDQLISARSPSRH